MVSATTANRNKHILQLQQIEDAIEGLLCDLGTGADMSSVPYDTAWVARLSSRYPGHDFEQPLEWLRRHQRPDGSWGADIVHHHDRFICTLAAILALHGLGRQEDKVRVRRGQAALWSGCGRRFQDANDTICFQPLALSMVKEAIALDLDVPRDLLQTDAAVSKNLATIKQRPAEWRKLSMVFSLEAVRGSFPEDAELLALLEENGSVGASPSATAAVLLHLRQADAPRALDYLSGLLRQQGDGGLPGAAPMECFEISWSLNQLQRVGAVSPDHPEARRALGRLWDAWSPETGASFSSRFPVSDLDDTSSVFTALKWGGYPVNAEVFAYYEKMEHFFTYPGEMDPSTGSHIHLLVALRAIPDHPKAAGWLEKSMGMLRRTGNGHLWFDKWHSSPYYSTADAVHAIHGIDDALVAPGVQWIQRTQRRDGGWGFYDGSTPEETAYGLQVLLLWARHGHAVDPGQLHAAARFLSGYMDDKDFTPLWLTKCLYTPPRVVRTAILAALFDYLLWRDSH